MNVAVTRAKRLCAIIADSGTVSKNKFLGQLISYFKENAQVQRSAFDYQGNPDVRIMYGQQSSGPVEKQELLNRNQEKIEKRSALTNAEKKKLKKERQKQVKVVVNGAISQVEEEKESNNFRYKFNSQTQETNDES